MLLFDYHVGVRSKNVRSDRSCHAQNAKDALLLNGAAHPSTANAEYQRLNVSDAFWHFPICDFLKSAHRGYYEA